MKHDTAKRFDYHVWANQKVFEHLQSLPKELFTKEIKSVFPSVSAVVVHMCVSDALWLNIISGGEYDEAKALAMRLNEELKEADIEKLSAFFDETAHQYQTFFEGAENLDAPLTVKHPMLGQRETSAAEMTNHVINHGTYHRGNISAMLRQMGHASVPTDYAYYVFQ
ncbi:DinB family protein [Bacillus glycinifermentans]|uniref:DinB family protein n=1 Tax=Bacillus glycinifermentans TaxID=1664069 RepID=UPI001FF19C44|nr:DinB family protein [Bacillus glycinifermentans]UOY89428.1 DinB family protein [Bacillus glycinifermentans]